MLIIKRLGIGALLLVPLTPLAVYLGFLFPYTSGRNFFFRALTLVALACWLALWIEKPEEYRPRSSFLSWAVLAFVAVVGIATARAPYPSLAFWSTLERMDGLLSTLFLAVFFFSAFHLLTARVWKIFFHSSLGTALVISFIALLQLFGFIAIHQGGVRIDATFGNASFFAAYMLLSAGLALFLASGEAMRRWRLAYVACASLFLFLALASGTRSVFVALPVALFISGIAAFFLRKDSANIKRFGIAALAGLALFVGLFFALRHTPLATHPLFGRLLSVSFTGKDAEARFLSWKIALKGVTERPFFGWGPEGFRSVFVNYYDPHLYGREQWFDRAHNTYLDWLIAGGALGLLAYLALWYGLVRAVWRRRNASFSAWEQITLSGMFTGYAVFNIFSFDTITASILFFSFLAYVESHRALRRARFEKLSPLLHQNEVATPPPQFFKTPRLSALRVALSFVIVAFTFFVFYFAIAKPALAAHYIWLGLQSDSPDLDTRLGYFTRAIALDTFATPEAREFLAQFAVDIASVPLTDESRKKIITLATQELARQMEASPRDPRYLLRLGATLNVYRAYAVAAPFLEQAVALSPDKQPSLYELGTSYLNTGRFDNAVNVFKHAAELLPDHTDTESKLLYAISLVYARRFAEAEAYMKKIFGVEVFADSRLADAYRRVGKREKANDIMDSIERREAAERTAQH